MAQRVTLRTRCSYNTKSARNKVVKTPGGKLVVQNLKKVATAPKCGKSNRSLAFRTRTVGSVQRGADHYMRVCLAFALV